MLILLCGDRNGIDQASDINISGMYCPQCERRISSALMKHSAVSNIVVSYKKGTLHLTTTVTKSAMKKL